MNDQVFSVERMRYNCEGTYEPKQAQSCAALIAAFTNLLSDADNDHVNHEQADRHWALFWNYDFHLVADGGSKRSSLF